jgi:helix-hairpin-helix protein
MPERLNDDVAGRLDEVARLLAAQGANRFRVGAYHRAANTVRRLARPVSDVLEREGIQGLQKLPGIGPGIARAIRDLLAGGRLAMLERLRGESEPLVFDPNNIRSTGLRRRTPITIRSTCSFAATCKVFRYAFPNASFRLCER